MMFIKEKKKQQ